MSSKHRKKYTKKIQKSKRIQKYKKKITIKKGGAVYHWTTTSQRSRSSKLDSETKEIQRLKKESKKQGEKIFIQMVINDYICKGKTWEDLQKNFRPSGAMSKWSRDTAELLGLKTTTNYSLVSPVNSPVSSPSKSKGKLKKKKKKKM